MTVDAWLRTATGQLAAVGIETARLDCLVLLEDCTGLSRGALLAEPGHLLTNGQLAHLTNLLKRRVQHEPLAYLRVRSEFFGREFVVSPAVLVPRPESEAIIEQLLGLPDLPVTPRIADVGCGSGALGITAKLELPEAITELLDIDDKALQVAKTNVDKFTIDVSLQKSNLLAKSTGNNDVLLCNLPYVPDDYAVNRAAAFEPKLALYGGPDGLDLYRELFHQVAGLQKRPLYILSEALPAQHLALKALAASAGYDLGATDHFVQVFRLAS